MSVDDCLDIYDLDYQNQNPHDRMQAFTFCKGDVNMLLRTNTKLYMLKVKEKQNDSFLGDNSIIEMDIRPLAEIPLDFPLESSQRTDLIQLSKVTKNGQVGSIFVLDGNQRLVKLRYDDGNQAFMELAQYPNDFESQYERIANYKLKLFKLINNFKKDVIVYFEEPAIKDLN